MNEGKVGGGGGVIRDEDNENEQWREGKGGTWEYPWAKEVSHFSLYMALELRDGMFIFSYFVGFPTGEINSMSQF